MFRRLLALCLVAGAGCAEETLIAEQQQGVAVEHDHSAGALPPCEGISLAGLPISLDSHGGGWAVILDGEAICVADGAALEAAGVDQAAAKANDSAGDFGAAHTQGDDGTPLPAADGDDGTPLPAMK